MIPQAMPNMVKAVRNLWVQRVTKVSLRRSRKVMVLGLWPVVRRQWPGVSRKGRVSAARNGPRTTDNGQLLQNNLLSFLQSFNQFGLDAVGNADLDGNFAPALLSLGIR